MPINSCQKGKRGERAWRDQLREAGYLKARRGQQFSGGNESPDVVCDDLPWAHWEVKCVEKLNIEKAMEQARRDCGKKTPIVAHKRSHCGWLVTMDSETFFRMLRGDFVNPQSYILSVVFKCPKCGDTFHVISADGTLRKCIPCGHVFPNQETTQTTTQQ